VKRKVVAIVQARMGSARLPGKVMKQINGAPVIELLLRRLSTAKLVDLIVVATPDDEENDSLVDYVSRLGYEVYRGSETDVLSRFYHAASRFEADVIVRITGDCPLADGALIDEVVSGYLSSDVDYFSNVTPPTYPDGLDVEVFSRDVLVSAHAEASSSYDREHVTSFIRESNRYHKGVHSLPKNFSDLRWTLDEPEDLKVIENIFTNFSPHIFFSWEDVLSYQQSTPDAFSANKKFSRNEGAMMSSGQKLYNRAKKIIPGGNMLLSKRPEMFLPNGWPSYFSKAKGCIVTDLDGNDYVDMSVMGIGTNILGYGHDEVDQAVRKTVDLGNMSTLNCSEEVYLAEKLVELHPWADMVKFARSGGEANAVAVRIARAAAGKDKVAICGYHGWHDWYLAANLTSDDSDALDGHLLPGLDPKGVPSSLRNTVFPFQYNDFETLKKIVESEDIGVIKMEVSRNKGPENDFLMNVRQLASKNNAVLVFDECTSGFRETNGGLHKKFGVEPDVAMFGKALGNGYAITAIVGKAEVMQAAQATFISSTFWTERIGPSAALKTLEVMEREKSWERITQTGLELRSGIQDLANNHHLEIEHFGLPALTGYNFVSPFSLEYKTLITQEMLKKGFLAANTTYISTSHSAAIIADYLQALDPIFGLIKECEEGRDVSTLLHGPVCHSGFRRLN